MLVFIAILLSLLPAVAVLYPFLRNRERYEIVIDESSLHSELLRRWDSIVNGMKTTELERAIGNLTDDDYRYLRRQYMVEAAGVMKAMELDEAEEDELLATIRREVRQVRTRVLGPDTDEIVAQCSHCSGAVDQTSGLCSDCGKPQVSEIIDPRPSGDAVVE